VPFLEIQFFYRNIAINMGASKILDYTSHQIDIARYGKALSHPARVAILQLLVERKTCICSDIVEDLPIAQSTVSQHLKELKLSGLIKGEIDGTSVCYCINEAEWEKASQLLSNFFINYEPNVDSCCSK
jgi:DNA-binding transcriptional ArsR family regulator